MSVSKYQMFLKTVECGSFSRAAEELNFTQSTTPSTKWPATKPATVRPSRAC